MIPERQVFSKVITSIQKALIQSAFFIIQNKYIVIMNTETVTINSLSATGHGIADNGWYILGTFPGDIVRARSYKNAEGIVYAEIQEIITLSSNRTNTPDAAPFFNANAPWEYLEEEYENNIKKEIVTHLFKKVADIELVPRIASQTRNDKLSTIHYRNKAAYSFMMRKGKLMFALYTRGVSGQEKIVQKDNILVHKKINSVAQQFLEFFNQKKVLLADLKYLVLRYSYLNDTIVAQILVTETNRKKLPWKKEDLSAFINKIHVLTGILVSHSEPNIRSSVTTKDFYELGNIIITEELAGKKYQYHPSQFFQIYPEAFSEILKDLEREIINIKNSESLDVLDLFSGVGVIGLHLADLVRSVHGVEYSPLAKEYALMNAQINGVSNFTFTEADVDEALKYIEREQILVIDPPRSGLSKKILETIVQVQSQYIFYISCNPETQAQDFKKLQGYYNITRSYVYNIFPKTPHIENLMCLKRKNTF